MSDRPAIIIFGAGLRPDGTPSLTLARRIEAALAFGRTLSNPLYMPTGGVGRFGASEGAAMAASLRAAGVDARDILPEETASDTFDSVIACRALLAGLGHRAPVYAASSAYHLPRCLLLLRLAGVAAAAVPPPALPASTRWHRRWYWRLREVAALPWDAVLMLRHTGRKRGKR
ncbi:YdcF family protein [Lichenicoccus sp.]|uniref:YdcF family protein n=1 Tax=Lichenicoccus sp. TaxID=2781899 RepID=UPI003D0E1A76